MSLFQCTACGGIDNTALGNFWTRQRERLPWLCAACDPDMQAWHGHFPQQSAVGYWVDAGGHLWQTPEQAPPTYTIIGQISDTEDAQTLKARWQAQHEEDTP
jgi:hypothetical protein